MHLDPHGTPRLSPRTVLLPPRREIFRFDQTDDHRRARGPGGKVANAGDSEKIGFLVTSIGRPWGG